MDINNFSDIEELINRKINSTMNYVNMAMNKVNNAEDIFNDVISGVKDKTEVFENKINNIREEKIVKKTNMTTAEAYINKKPQGRFKGILLSIAGVIGIVISLMLMLSVSIISTIINIDVSALNIILIVLILFNIVNILRGSSIRKRIKRFKKYVECINNKHYCEINRLSEEICRSNKFVIKDIKKMILLGMFKEAHIDVDNSYLILGNKVYEEYLLMQESYNNRKNEEETEEDNEKVFNEDNIEKTEIDMVIEAGEKYIEEIKYANIYIQEENMTLKLNKLEGILKEIFKTIRKNPEKVNGVRKVINHYLPITSKLVNSYKDLNNQSIVGENIKKAKTEIEESIDLINNAFERLLDDLFEEVAMDISSDISVLKTLFAQEGLTEEDFKKNK